MKRFFLILIVIFFSLPCIYIHGNENVLHSTLNLNVPKECTKVRDIHAYIVGWSSEKKKWAVKGDGGWFVLIKDNEGRLCIWRKSMGDRCFFVPLVSGNQFKDDIPEFKYSFRHDPHYYVFN